MIKIDFKANRNVKIKVLEKTSSGARFLDLKGKILKTKDQFVYIGSYVVDMNNIVKWDNT